MKLIRHCSATDLTPVGHVRLRVRLVSSGDVSWCLQAKSDILNLSLQQQLHLAELMPNL